MKHLVLLVFAVFTNTIVSGQNFEVYADSLNNVIMQPRGDQHWNRFHQSTHGGYTIGIGVNNIILDSLPKTPLRFTLRLDNYSNYLYTYSGSRGPILDDEVIFEKTNISLGAYPVNIKLIKNLELGLGLEIGLLIKSKTKGYSTYGNAFSSYYTSKNLEDEKNPIHYTGLVPSFAGRIAYKILLSNRVSITPQGDYSYGLRPEFENISLDVKSRRWSIKIGLDYRM